jgi:hypothetical protein
MSTTQTADVDEFWTCISISSFGLTKTYEHRYPHGTLIRVTSRSAEAITFVPAPPSEGGPYR